MGLKSVAVPEALEPPFAKAESYVETLFGGLDRKPSEGTIRVGDDRYVLMRCESLYATWFDALTASFGEETARDFIYNTAREIGRSDSAEFSRRLGVNDPVERLSSGPVHFAYAGWARVEILPDSAPAPDSSFYIHYYHPNTFEAEVLLAKGRTTDKCACLFSAGYSAGWCTDAFKMELHGREIRCTAKGDPHCEFIMAPAEKLDGHEARLLG
ncbi:MAG: V4R domain-containing protein [Myxococcota bacterium]